MVCVVLFVPDSPVITTSWLRGRSRSMFLRLCVRAPRMLIRWLATTLPRYLPSVDEFNAGLASGEPEMIAARRCPALGPGLGEDHHRHPARRRNAVEVLVRVRQVAGKGQD